MAISPYISRLRELVGPRAPRPPLRRGPSPRRHGPDPPRSGSSTPTSGPSSAAPSSPTSHPSTRPVARLRKKPASSSSLGRSWASSVARNSASPTPTATRPPMSRRSSRRPSSVVPRDRRRRDLRRGLVGPRHLPYDEMSTFTRTLLGAVGLGSRPLSRPGQPVGARPRRCPGFASTRTGRPRLRSRGRSVTVRRAPFHAVGHEPPRRLRPPVASSRNASGRPK